MRPLGEDAPEFLAWSGGDTSAQQALIADFESHIDAVGDTGCGYEAQLEAWYRFLVDPQPPSGLDLVSNQATSVGVDQVLLAQREAFLRPHGFVAIVLLTDEDDCSLMDGGSYYQNAGFGYLISTSTVNGTDYLMPVATPTCETNPNSECCLSCLQRAKPPAQCAAEVMDTCGASPDPTPTLSREEDNKGVRCFAQKQRFGVDLLYPIERYEQALTQQEIIDARDGTLVYNPLMTGVDGSEPEVARDPQRVLFMGVVGVPWQDIATEASLEQGTDELTYLSPAELREKNVQVGAETVDRWAMILGQPGIYAGSKQCESGEDEACGQAPVPPLDPFMIASIEPRPTGALNPITQDAIVDPSSTDPFANAINGHEYSLSVPENESVNGDLQYSCIFQLEAPIDETTCTQSISCDCSLEPSRNRPLCNPPQGGTAEAVQYFGKAYPAPRILQLVRDLDQNGLVASICPKNPSGDATDPNFGYNPAVRALITEIGRRVDAAQQ